MNSVLKSAVAMAALGHEHARPAAQAVFYEHDGLHGSFLPRPRSRSAISRASDSTTAPPRSSCCAIAGRFARTPASRAAASCCVREGIPRLSALGLNDRVSSARTRDEECARRGQPLRPRAASRLRQLPPQQREVYEANVTSVRARHRAPRAAAAGSSMSTARDSRSSPCRRRDRLPGRQGTTANRTSRSAWTSRAQNRPTIGMSPMTSAGASIASR
jgi:hypothetical protein